jgi:hypothetical protein
MVLKRICHDVAKLLNFGMDLSTIYSFINRRKPFIRVAPVFSILTRVFIEVSGTAMIFPYLYNEIETLLFLIRISICN